MVDVNFKDKSDKPVDVTPKSASTPVKVAPEPSKSPGEQAGAAKDAKASPPTPAKPGSLSPGTSKVPTTQSTAAGPRPSVVEKDAEAKQQAADDRMKQETERAKEQGNKPPAEGPQPVTRPPASLDDRRGPNDDLQKTESSAEQPETAGKSRPASPVVTQHRETPQGDPANSGAVTNSVTPMVPPHGAQRFEVGEINFNNEAEVNKSLEQFVSVVKVHGAYTHKGVCLKCGWQSHQHSEEDAKNMVRGHAQKHLREVL